MNENEDVAIERVPVIRLLQIVCRLQQP